MEPNIKNVIKKIPFVCKAYSRYIVFCSNIRYTVIHSNILDNKYLEKIRNEHDVKLAGLHNCLLLKRNLESIELKIKTKIALYTVISGDYDDLIKPLDIDETHFDYYCVTDNPKIKSDFWRIIYIDKNNEDNIKDLDNCRVARYLKTHPHLIFPNYEHSLFVDANVLIKGPMYQWITTWICDNDLLISAHPIRDCIYDEGKKCKEYKLDYPQIIDGQLNKYREENYPEHSGLVMSNIIYRVHSEKIINLDEKWWDEIQNFSRRDQLSFNYVVYKTRTKISCCPINTYKNKYFSLVAHKEKHEV